MAGRRQGLVACAALAAASLALATLLLATGQMLRDNGDGGRILGPAFAAPAALPVWEPLPRSFAMAPLAEGMRWPDDLAALPAWALALAQKAVGADHFHLLALVWLYAALFLTGLWALWRDLAGPWARAALVAGGAFAGQPAFAAFLASPYEEGFALALAPLFVHLAAFPARRGAALAALIGAGFVAAKAALALLLPAALPAIATRRRGAGRLVLIALVIAVSGATVARQLAERSWSNAFNRVFNGLAYAQAGVGGWQARSWTEREDIAPEAVGPAPGWLAPELRPLWGLSFHPQGAALPPDLRRAAIAEGRWRRMALRLAAEPALIAKTAYEASRTALRADFRLCYLRPERCAGGPPGLGVARHAGLVFLLAPALAGLALWRRRWGIALMLLAGAAAPTAVSLADGYFEFEKHLVIFAAVIALAAPAALSPPRRSSPDPAPPRRRP